MKHKLNLRDLRELVRYGLSLAFIGIGAYVGLSVAMDTASFTLFGQESPTYFVLGPTGFQAVGQLTLIFLPVRFIMGIIFLLLGVKLLPRSLYE